MIQAKKATLVANFHQQTLEVRKMELDYYLMVFDKLSSISSLLAGFASSALMIGIPRRDNPYLVTIFLFSTGSALGSHLLVVIVTTMCIMWGPGHALRGEDASYVDNAVYILDTAKRSMEKFFMFGLVCYFTSSILVVWLLFDFTGSVTVSSIFCVLLCWLYGKSRKIYSVLQPGKYVSGHINFNRVKNIGELMGDTSLSAETGVSAKFATHI
eukprot:CAMPEP_0171103500 /NCGR_PEP_ID=MMETSP0766_2-20121228/58950_1 /TAXON_ID=439317 /ORGANISM="Gambierdiscus australes, Strain CAWD 149" /LENGTH=212 /DNA_ID=CAMNT_0011563929 /DNA_START=123 /DNA_END=761 /DNA_ORIENTATION=+